ncbi:bile acid:sodium symporter [Desulfosporosinus sp. Sb-LF]|uniref:bile acid:sodium symporter family protein n=1 Tax=Desulfosporosinus sp. Sb-LF TaxID=2560027 RepID=UPI00107F36C5|nr:bile acid:sodium symporter [Desulfosporosinus sp. Sb-LF]TGE32400.1 bile acid:sodium symporter family protein [Desulfosporosinus sp. Sb-LF]
MTDRFIKWNHFLGRRMFFVVLLALLLGFCLPLPKTPILSTLSVALFAYMTFITALGTKFRDFLQVLSKPWVPLWMLLLIHGIAPLLAWAIGAIFYPQDFFVRLGLLVSASIPIAVTSIIWTSLAGGNVALALVAVTLDTLIVPFIMPSYFAFIVGKTIELDYVHMLFQLLWMVTIPSFLGMGINDLTRGKLDLFSRSVGGFTSKIALFMVVAINASIVAPEIHWNPSLIKLLSVILLLTVLGYSLGYVGSLILRERNSDTVIAMIYNVGMRNISFGAVLAIGYFPPQVSVPVTLAMLFQQPTATLVFYLLKLSRPEIGL